MPSWTDLATVLGRPEGVLTIAVLAAALPFRPWAVLRRPALQHLWLGTLVVLPWWWSVHVLLPARMPLQLSGACLLVLMFGWPLAVWTLVPVAAAAAWLGGMDPSRATDLLWWLGLLPATLGLGLGLLTRRFLPHHLFVYIIARGFFATALAMMLAGAARVLLAPPVPEADTGLLLVGHVLIAWGEAFATGGLTAVFVAFRPEWLLTWSDRRYLPVDRP
jgi:uncharacterized membrane protein